MCSGGREETYGMLSARVEVAMMAANTNEEKNWFMLSEWVALMSYVDESCRFSFYLSSFYTPV